MGNEYNHHHHSRHNHCHRSSFMPMLCSSTKDSVVSFSDHKKYYKDEPASPRVGCMGQIKRNNKVVGFPTHHRCNDDDDNRKYFKLKRIFSSKSLSSRKQMIMGGSSSISIVDLDPPLPVTKPVQRVGDDGVSLWKRRCGGDSLKGLQLQQIILNQPPFHEN